MLKVNITSRRGRPRTLYGTINIDYQMMIAVIKQKHRLMLISKGDMYAFIKKHIDADYEDKHTKREMVSELERYLNVETIKIYIREFDLFGICKKDLMSLLKIRRSSMISALEANGITFKNIQYHTNTISKGRYHLFNPDDVLKLNGYQPQ